MVRKKVTLAALEAESAQPEGAPRPLHEAAMVEIGPANDALDLLVAVGKITEAEAYTYWQWLVAVHYGVAEHPAGMDYADILRDG